MADCYMSSEPLVNSISATDFLMPSLESREVLRNADRTFPDETPLLLPEDVSMESSKSQNIDCPQVNSERSMDERSDKVSAFESDIQNYGCKDASVYTNCDKQESSGVLFHPLLSEKPVTSVDISNDVANTPGYSSVSSLFLNQDRPGTPIPLPRVAQYWATASQMSSCSDIYPVCRICHQHELPSDHLFAPCRCAGSLQYIHHSCLLAWIRISTNKNKRPPKCEICDYTYHRHKKFKIQTWKYPTVSKRDKCLHFAFLMNFLIMIGCSTATIMCFLSDKGHISKFPKNTMHFTTEEIVTLTCGVLFFISFFLAMSVQIKAKRTLYKLIKKFILMNISWEIEEYDKRKDIKT